MKDIQDLVVLLTNNIISIKNDWPLDSQSFNKYVLDKYETEENLYASHHYETLETRDKYGRVIVPGGLIVDPRTSFDFESDGGDYSLPAFPAEESLNIASVNLNQKLIVGTRDEDVEIIIPEITQTISNFYSYTRENEQIKLTINNTYDGWPESWGGTLIINGRNEIKRIIIDYFVGPLDILINEDLYEVVGEFVNGVLTPVFSFKVQ